MGFIIRMGITALGLWLAARWVDGISIQGDATLLWAALLLGFVNAIVRPIAVFLTLPITVVTLGLFLWVINGVMLQLVAWMLTGFEVRSLGPALLGAAIVGITGWLGAAFIGPRGRYEVMVTRKSGSREVREEIQIN